MRDNINYEKTMDPVIVLKIGPNANTDNAMGKLLVTVFA